MLALQGSNQSSGPANAIRVLVDEMLGDSAHTLTALLLMAS